MRLEMSPCVTHAKNKAKYYPRHSWREKKKEIKTKIMYFENDFRKCG